jgi:hypothetical protein
LFVSRTHGGEQEHVPNGWSVGQEHDQPVEPEAEAAGGRHAKLDGFEERFVDVRCGVSLIAIGESGLRGEKLALEQRIVQLRIGVRELHPRDVQFEPFDQFGVPRLARQSGEDSRR